MVFVFAGSDDPDSDFNATPALFTTPAAKSIADRNGWENPRRMAEMAAKAAVAATPEVAYCAV